MTSKGSGVQARLNQIKGFLVSKRRPQTIPWDPDCVEFPSRKEIPELPNAPPGAAWFWGKDDYLGRINLLTPARVKLASAEIRLGEMIPLNLPLDVPNPPAFGRQNFKHEISVILPELAFDDTYSMNTQSGTQWDGFRHVSHIPTKTFYNNTKFDDIQGPNADQNKASIHHLSEHGICGRGVLLDYWGYAQKKGKWYDSCERHQIPYEELVACGKDQGIDIRPESQGGHIKVGDLLLIRSGWTAQFESKSQEQWSKLALREMEQQSWAGLEASEKIIDWLHDCYFAAVAGDAPSFEAWPPGDNALHSNLLGLWGCPIGEFWDLEKLTKRCKELNRWTFFLTSSPANCKGGVGSHANAIAIL